MELVSKAVRTPGHYVTAGLWDESDLTPLQKCLTGFWLVTLRVTINPEIVFQGDIYLRIWDTTISAPQDLDPTKGKSTLVVQEKIDPTKLEFLWDPAIMLTEQTWVKTPDGRDVMQTFYLRYFFKQNMRIQVLDRVGANYTVVANNAQRVTMDWIF